MHAGLVSARPSLLRERQDNSYLALRWCEYAPFVVDTKKGSATMIVPASLTVWLVASGLLVAFIALGVFLARWAPRDAAPEEVEEASVRRPHVIPLPHVDEGAAMPPSEYFSIHGEVRNGVARLSLGGELDLDNASKIEEHLELLDREHVDATILDLRTLTFIDFAGFRAVVRASDDAARLGKGFAVVNPTDSARRLFELCRAERLLDHDRDLLEAFSKVSSPVHAA
jgi:stage II sporulation protein AA (anti-sigma F factor antagonist)